MQFLHLNPKKTKDVQVGCKSRPSGGINTRNPLWFCSDPQQGSAEVTSIVRCCQAATLTADWNRRENVLHERNITGEREDQSVCWVQSSVRSWPEIKIKSKFVSLVVNTRLNCWWKSTWCEAKTFTDWVISFALRSGNFPLLSESPWSYSNRWLDEMYS